MFCSFLHSAPELRNVFARMFQTGIESWIERKTPSHKKSRMGLISHAAAVNARGVPSLDLLCKAGLRPAALFGPEHGFFGQAGPGAAVGEQRHPQLRIPIHSLYGATRTPKKAWLENLDLLVFDLQDLGVRCYTYLSTLRGVLEAASGTALRVVVADRPIPLPNHCDGPLLDPTFQSFVADVPSPMTTGMTPAEAARWLIQTLKLDVDLEIAAMTGYSRSSRRGPGWPVWRPPSPAIRSWAGATTYPATVWAEALPSLDCNRSGQQAFQVLGAIGIHASEWIHHLRRFHCDGVEFQPVRFRSRDRLYSGVQLVVRDPDSFRPVYCAAALLSTAQTLLGLDGLWTSPGSRLDFFDQLAGTSAFRKNLIAGLSIPRMTEGWRKGRSAFEAARASALIYAPRHDLN